MTGNLRRAASAFLVGMLGWVLAPALHIEGWAVFAAVIVIGAVGGLVAPHPVFLPLVWLGTLTAIPLNLALGIWAFIETDLVAFFYLVVLFALMAAGFGASVVAVRWRSRARPT